MSSPPLWENYQINIIDFLLKLKNLIEKLTLGGLLWEGPLQNIILIEQLLLGGLPRGRALQDRSLIEQLLLRDLPWEGPLQD